MLFQLRAGHSAAELCYRQALMATQATAPSRLAVFLRLAMAAGDGGNEALAQEAVSGALDTAQTYPPCRFAMAYTRVCK